MARRCIDGLHPGELSLELLIKCEKRPETSPQTRDILQRIFDFFIHMTSDQVARGASPRR